MEIKIFTENLHTERLILRPLSLQDTDAMYEYTSNPAVTTHLSWYAHTDIKTTRKFIENVLSRYENKLDEFVFGIELKSENKLIGVVRVFNVCFSNRRGEFSSILNPNYQRKGYIGEAWQGLLKHCFETLGLNRIQSYVTVDNIPSQRKNDKAGLTLEGRLRQYWYQKNEYYDALVYSIVADDYHRLKEEKEI